MLSLIPPRVWAYLGGGLVAVLVTFFAVSTVLSWKHAAERLPQVERELAAVQDEYFEINEAIGRQEKRLREARNAANLLTESLKNEISKNSAYATCSIPAGFMRLRNEAIDARNAR